MPMRWLAYSLVILRLGLSSRWSCGLALSCIARLTGHSSSRTTETICLRELQPVITTGAEVMYEIFR